MSARDSKWERAVREHRTALSSFLAFSGRVDPAVWDRPLREGKWSPAQVAEHLALTYEALLRELSAGEPMRPRVGSGMQRILRWVLLPHILFHRSVPVAARAPREARPSPGGLERAAAAERLGELGERFERALLERRDVLLTHPYFGRIPALRALRFCAIHIEHHLRQIESAGVARR